MLMKNEYYICTHCGARLINPPQTEKCTMCDTYNSLKPEIFGPEEDEMYAEDYYFNDRITDLDL